jgi:hypothetical protein
VFSAPCRPGGKQEKSGTQTLPPGEDGKLRAITAGYGFLHRGQPRLDWREYPADTVHNAATRVRITPKSRCVPMTAKFAGSNFGDSA